MARPSAIYLVHTAQIACRAPRAKNFRNCSMLYVRCSPHRCPFEQLGNPAYCQHLGGHMRGAHRANRMSGSAHKNFQKMYHTICAVLSTQMELRMRFARSTPYKSPRGGIYVVYTARMRFECDLLAPHRTNRPRVQSMWCTPLECDLLGAHRTNHPRVQYMWTRMRITRGTPRNSPKGPCLGTLFAPFRGPSQGPLVTIEPK